MIIPRRQLENDYYDDEHLNSYERNKINNDRGEYKGFVFNNIPAIYVGAGVLLLVLLMRK